MSLRCAYCHDSLGAIHSACSACGTRQHFSCARELGACPTQGCADKRSLRAQASAISVVRARAPTCATLTVTPRALPIRKALLRRPLHERFGGAGRWPRRLQELPWQVWSLGIVALILSAALCLPESPRGCRWCWHYSPRLEESNALAYEARVFHTTWTLLEESGEASEPFRRRAEHLLEDALRSLERALSFRRDNRGRPRELGDYKPLLDDLRRRLRAVRQAALG